MGSSTPHFPIRGYYTIISRNQLWGLQEWRRFVDCMVEDGCNFLILWIEGGFPSRKFPETWSYNREHPNMSQNFAGELIDYAKSSGLQTVLGFTPYAYDGIACYVKTYPELAGLREDGEIKCSTGIHDVAMVMCPSKERTREVMLEYAREMYFDFYPNADGLFIESSDYGHCLCPECRENYTLREWEFVSAITNEVWAHNPSARNVVYPLYFQKNVAEPDPRYTLFFTPHSAQMTPDVMVIDCDKIYWTMLFGEELESAKRAAVLAADNGLQGYVPAMETFGITKEINGVGYRLTPFDVPWAKPGTFEFADLIPSVLRFAYRCHSRQPYMTDEDFVSAVAKKFLAPGQHDAARDLIYLCSALQQDYRAWWFRSSLVHPEEFDRQYPEDKRVEARQRYAETLSRLADICRRHQSSRGTAGEMSRIAGWVVQRWPDA